ncbi:serine/threonine protein kinase [Deinococcus taeanensis]|uniref:serine/threonine-protein kinase n=1 Tax=Deinococcus taeanensis TaxID=2737050 RepID=UPI001CDD1243|nr:serine/threonine-protein kinase [Deinococcus taeanensis]UBV42551.1 serine/threonine protein kinase [Deinococcus taeanensis]
MTEPRTITAYKLHRVLGRGNTSLVRLATNAQGQLVALKIPHTQTLTVQEAAERFGNEVRLTLQLRHPHLVRGYDGMPFGPNAFLAVTYYPKGALSEQLRDLPERTLPLQEALRILADVASALTYLHHMGAVHQDVKTQNVYVTDDGRGALGDLGNTYFVAQGGKISGSPYYMAPEIYRGEGSSSASDVYSLGIMTYELLTGERPYQGNTYEELMVAHMTRFPASLTMLKPTLSRSVARLAELALAKRAGDRPTADQLRRALLSALGETPADEVYEPEPKTEVEVTRPAGRHGLVRPGPGVTPDTPTEPDGKSGARWNPFRRRKS